MRVVLVLLVVGVILWLLAARARARPAQGKLQPEAFTRCAHCGVHLPINDAVVDRASAYCSEAHRLAGPGQCRFVSAGGGVERREAP
jgi:uncharacterized protein